MKLFRLKYDILVDNKRHHIKKECVSDISINDKQFSFIDRYTGFITTYDLDTRKIENINIKENKKAVN